MSPTWKPEMERRCTRPENANRSRSAGSRLPRVPSSSASTSGARLPYSRRARAATALRARSEGPGSERTVSAEETSSIPPGLPPRPARRTHRPCTRACVPARTPSPAPQRRSIDPRHAESTTTARARPRPDAGSRSRTSSETRPSGRSAAQRHLSWASASAAAATPTTNAPSERGNLGSRRRSSTAAMIAATPAGAPKCRRPVARPAPYVIGTSTPAGGITAGGRRSGALGLPPAARCHGHLLQRFHQHDVDHGAALVALEVEFGDDGALERVHVSRGNAIEGVDQHVALADRTPAELGKVAAQPLVGGENVLLDEVLDHAMASSRSAGETRPPVNVEPVVPERRTIRYCPASEAGTSTSTRWLVRVRASIDPPRRAGRSTRTSCTVPTRATFFRRAWSRTAPTRRASRSDATASPT